MIRVILYQIAFNFLTAMYLICHKGNTKFLAILVMGVLELV